MFLVLNSLLSVNGRILRIPCMIDAVFDVVFFDKRLQGNSLAVFNSIDDQGCTLKCAENHKCTSYNYQWIDKTCEIYQKHVQQDNSTDLLDANGWIFKTTNYSNKLIGPTCNSLKPCDPEDLCLDTCSPPFYECIHCQSHYPELKCIKQADVDACASNPCKHASQCLNKSSDYKCTCLEGYTGKNCDIARKFLLRLVYVAISPPICG
ncbi:protein jagged-1a-like [Rhopilema esculentum]|uniref:protein jagged-1a-like n=1 Tax=Rhopilema esculentum TaxID=499914 RepID=UPI0031CE999F